VSCRLQQLEDALGVRLINRNSRSLSLTDAGETFYRHAVEALRHADLAANAVRERLVEPCGTVRFTTSVAMSLYALRPIVPEFIRRHPKINLIQHTTDDQVDIVGRSFDLAVRAHTAPLVDSTLVQRLLACVPWRLYAAPDYLDQRGAPHAPDDLACHDKLTMLWPAVPASWKLAHPTQGQAALTFEPRFSGNDLIMLKHAAEAGLGIVSLPAYICRDAVAAGTLTPVLPDWLSGEARISALIPCRDGLPQSVRTFVDFLVEEVPRIVC
jgi:DNA-binding transcriptional LysR family regulator